MSVYFGLCKADIDRRARALDSFAKWEALQEGEVPPALALQGVGFIWELLPPGSRERPPNTTGVQTMHAILSHLGTRG